MIKIGNNGNVKNVVVPFDQHIFAMDIRTQNCKNLPTRKVVINDICVHIRNRIGNTFEDGYSCDSTFMLNVMDDIAKHYTHFLLLG